RIGLSATQRPLDEVARFLGGCGTAPSGRAPARGAGVRHRGKTASHDRGRTAPTRARGALGQVLESDSSGRAWRPVAVVDAGARKALELTLEVPVEDMARLEDSTAAPSGAAAQAQARPSIWTHLHPRLLELIQAHRSTLLFVNSRRVAERLAAALNELAGATLARAHHGSLARLQRLEVEDELKAGRVRALVATSSLELGIDMGAIDLVVQIEAPPSVASGLQRIGRAGHHVNAASRGVIFPKYRGDLIACAAATRAMHQGLVEATRFPRNPLDVLAQQIVAMVAMDDWLVDELLSTIRRAAPFADLQSSIFDNVLDMLSGRYPSDDFAELRPRITWDRVAGKLTARESARRVAVINGGTIPDRGLYGVFLADGRSGATRVGELDEEMVFETHVGETFVLGASTWRIDHITHDRVLVVPAPGEPGKLPFWKGEAATRPLEFGRSIGALIRTLHEMPPAAAKARLVREHDLAPGAAENLLQYCRDQKVATGVLPDDRTVLVERCRDELGDWRVCVVSPFGGQVLAPWALAATAHIRRQTGLDVESMWTDEGFVVRFPDTDAPPETSQLLPPAGEIERLVVEQLGASALFAARFRECAARALLLPRRRPGQRTPLWQQRKKASDLLAVASRFGSFPMVLETYRECLRDLFDVPALVALMSDIESRRVEITTVDSRTPSPFAASQLFGYVANYLYDGDAPLAERRAQALSIDQEQLRALLGEAELRELLDVEAIEDVDRQLQALAADYQARSVDGLHDLLLRVGDLSAEEVVARTQKGEGRAWIGVLHTARRAIQVSVGGEVRFIAVEEAARFRDGLGSPLPPGLPASLLGPVPNALSDLVARYARTHAPFTAAAVARRFGVAQPVIERILHEHTAGGRLMEGAFRPDGQSREWCATDVLQAIRRRSLAKLRKEVAPVESHDLARFFTVWQGLTQPRTGLDAVLDAVEHLQGAPIALSVLETDVLPARIREYDPGHLDTLMSAGEVVWVGLESLGEHDGRVALFLTDHVSRLWRPERPVGALAGREERLVAFLAREGASFFGALHDAAGGGYPGDTVDALWSLVWRGLITNDSFHAVRHYMRPATRSRRAAAVSSATFRSRRTVPARAEGRWSLVALTLQPKPRDTAWSAAMATQLLNRYGIVSREAAGAEALGGGFTVVYDVLRSMEERGKVRRGYFASGVGAAQFALPTAVDLLRSLRQPAEEAEVVWLSATDPANAYGAILPWPKADVDSPGGRGASRSAGAHVVLVNGRLGAWLSRNQQSMVSFLPDTSPERDIVGRGVARALAAFGRRGREGARGLLIADVNGLPAARHPLGAFLKEAGFSASPLGYQPPVERVDPDRAAMPRTRRPGAGRGAVSSPFRRSGTE
ncbi:MAG: helicase-related protein, partial [Vicinamibacterales bacterium]